MKRTVRKRLATAVGALGIAACDPSPAPEAGAPAAVEPEPSPAAQDETPTSTPGADTGAPPISTPEPEDPAASAAGAAITEIMAQRDPFARARGLGELLPRLGPEGVKGARLALLDPDFQSTRGGVEIELLTRFWATHEPEAASRWAMTEAARGYRLSAVFAAVSQWAAVDPVAAAAAVATWEASLPKVADILQISLIHGWFERDPEALGAYLVQLPEGISRQRQAASYVRLLTRSQGPEAATRWAEGLPDEDAVFKRNVFRQVATSLAVTDVDAARRWCDVHCDGPYGEGLHNAIGVAWIQSDGGSAPLEWLARQPEGKSRNAALKSAFATWATLDYDAASGWIESQFRGADGDLEPWMELLVSSYALILMRDSPADAIPWVERVPDEHERKVLLMRVLRAWRWRDEPAAEAWLSASSLTEEERESARLKPRIEDRGDRI